MRKLSTVFCTIASSDKFEAISEVISSCALFDELPDKKHFVDAVHKRERIQSTGIGHGVAIAHGKVPGVESPKVALGFSEKGIIFDEKYPEPVRLVFVIASSPSHEADYLKAVSSILSWVHDPEFRAMLVSGVDNRRTEKFFAMLRRQLFVPQQME